MDNLVDWEQRILRSEPRGVECFQMISWGYWVCKQVLNHCTPASGVLRGGRSAL